MMYPIFRLHHLKIAIEHRPSKISPLWICVNFHPSTP